MLADYACHGDQSRGRLVAEPESAHRSPFQRDRDRIIHSTAFRRLKHKTQVFVEHEGDHYRTRLTHSIEVAQVARTIARALQLNEALTEAVALAHDLGHTPFGHTGEDALAECMAPFGGFDHNAQAIRIVTHLEQHYADFDGLNLTWECLEGIAKHNGPLDMPLPRALADYNARHDLEVSTHASAEAQVAALADDIAYNHHDLDDGLRAGLFDLDAVADLPILRDCLAEVKAKYPALTGGRLHHETLRRVFSVMVEDVLDVARANLAQMHSVTEIRGAGRATIAFSTGLDRDLRAIRDFLFAHMYRAKSVKKMRRKTSRTVKNLFALFMDDPTLLPADWACDGQDELTRAYAVCDYVAGMTDRYALKRAKALT